MWQRRIFFRFLLHRVYNIKKSRIIRRIDRKDLNLNALGLGCDDDWELGKQKSRKKRKITESKNDDEVRSKRKIAGEDGVSDRNIEIDRISELPESIIHHIFSFLRCSKDVVRTTILSKNWKRMLDSYQSFDFDQRWFRMPKGRGWLVRIEEREVQKKKFIEYVEKSVATRLARVESVDKFRFYADDVDFSLMICCLRSICAAKAKNVRELDVQVYGEKEMLPSYWTLSTSVTFLKLAGYSLHSLAVTKNCNLRGLSIKDAKFLDVNVMKNLEEKCPFLEDLRLVGCPSLSHVEISSLVKLRRFEVQDCAGVRRIEIAASNLETFWYHAKDDQECKIDLKGSENLRNLTLKDRVMSDSEFLDFISLCSLLEKLVLHNCNSINKLTICSLTLKSLALIQCVRLEQVDIDASNLYSFHYDGHMMHFPSVLAPRLSEAKFSFKPNVWRSIFKFENFFWNFNGFKGIKLIVYTKQNMKIFEEPRRADLFQTNTCKIELTASSSKLVKTVDNWLRECHGKSLILSSSNSELIKLVNTLIIDREDNPSCCRFYSNTCWRHHIEDVKVSTLETVDNTSFDFTWRRRKRRVKFYEDQDFIA